jgi:glycosyltransferase involved in cell wall biosynthesis
MKDFPVVTVVIPVYNGASYVVEAVDSVLAEAGVGFEIILGDNASTDNTLAVLQRYSGDSRIRILESEKNLGIYGNLSRLMQAAKAPLVKILCADDYLLPGGLARQVTYMQERPHLAFSRCWSEGDALSAKRLLSRKLELGLPTELYPPSGHLAFAAFGCLTGNLSRAIVRPGMLGSELRFDLTLPYSGDYEFWSRLAIRFPFGLQNEELVYVRRHPLQSTHVLNKYNELSMQMNALMDRFAAQVSPAALRVLRWHWAIIFVSQHWHRGMRHLLAGRFKAARVSCGRRSYTFNNIITFTIYVLSLNGRIGRSATTSKILKMINKDNNVSVIHGGRTTTG